MVRFMWWLISVMVDFGVARIDNVPTRKSDNATKYRQRDMIFISHSPFCHLAVLSLSRSRTVAFILSRQHDNSRNLVATIGSAVVSILAS